MRLHFSIGGYDYRRTARFRHSIHLSITHVIFADHVHWRSGVDNKFSFLRFKSWCRQAPIFRRWEECCFVFLLFIFKHFWPASTLLRGPTALATLSPPETDPQILERWRYADEVHLGKSVRAKGFGLECMRGVQQLLRILHVGLAQVCLSSSVKNEDFGGSISWNTQPICRVFDELHTTGLSPDSWPLRSSHNLRFWLPNSSFRKFCSILLLTTGFNLW